jgi:hypothetical protein
MNIETITPSNPLWLEILEVVKHDIYHLPEYTCIEAKRLNALPEAILISDGSKQFFLPYLIKEFSDDWNLSRQEVLEVVSPYGYPGMLLNSDALQDHFFLQSAVNCLVENFNYRGVCSAFLRLHPLLNYGFEELLSPQLIYLPGTTVVIDLRLSEEELWRQTRADHRQRINWCKRNGLTAKVVSFANHINDFISIYEETMNRLNAAEGYYFDLEYYSALAQLKDNVNLGIIELDSEIIFAGIFTECNKIIQYHLSGTKNQFLKHSPNRLMIDFIRRWAKERGNHFMHLGGGLGGKKDTLFNFKSGFSKQTYPFLTMRLICNSELYRELVSSRAKHLNTAAEELLDSSFFPAYRSKI